MPGVSSDDDAMIAWARKVIGAELAAVRAGAPVRAEPERHTIADLESKLAILDRCEAAIRAGRIPEGATWSDDAAGAEVAGDVARLLAAGYRHRTDYRQEWVPA